MAKKFSELVARTMSPESQERARLKTRELLAEMALDELRAALSLTQEHLAETLGVKQSSVSKIIRGQNMYISTLDKVIKAMGGDLEIFVALPNGKIKLSLEQFRAVANDSSKKRSHDRNKADDPLAARVS
ncbi:MAG: helix-turn-helix transcriptional regulator [Candidatus Korobacteraceae bacterium]